MSCNWIQLQMVFSPHSAIKIYSQIFFSLENKISCLVLKMYCDKSKDIFSLLVLIFVGCHSLAFSSLLSVIYSVGVSTIYGKMEHKTMWRTTYRLQCFRKPRYPHLKYTLRLNREHISMVYLSEIRLDSSCFIE